MFFIHILELKVSINIEINARIVLILYIKNLKSKA